MKTSTTDIRKTIRNYLLFWYPPVLATAVPVAVVIVMAALGLSLGSVSMDMGVDMGSVTYLIILTSVICMAYLLRYKELGLRYDFVSVVAFFQFLIISAFNVAHFSDTVSNFVVPIIGLSTVMVLTAGLPWRAERKEWPPSLMAIWIFAPTVLTLAFLYSLGNMSTGILAFLSGAVIDAFVHALVAAIALFLIFNLWRSAFGPFRNSFNGMMTFSALLIAGTLIHFMSTATLDLAWWVSNLIIWQSSTFVLWGLLMDYGQYSEKSALAYRLTNQVQNSLRRETPGRLSADVTLITSSGLAGSGSFSYTSIDGNNWELENEILPPVENFGPMPRTLNLELREQMLDETNSFISSFDDTATGRKLNDMSVVPCGGAVFRATNGRFHFVGIRERERRWWERDEIMMLKSIATALGLAAYQRETSAKRAKMIMQLLSITHAVERLFSASDPEGLRSEIIRLVADDMEFDNVSLWTMEENGSLTPRNFRWRGKSERELNLHDVLLTGVGIIGTVALTSRPLLANDVTAEPSYVNPIGSDTKSEYAVPVIQDGRVIAVLDVQSSQKNAFDTMDTEVIDTIAMLLSAGLDLYRAKSEIIRQKNMAETRAGLISHDLRNIFQPIRIYMQMLLSDMNRDGAMPLKDMDYVTKTLSSIDSATAFLENTLKILRLQSGSIAEPKECNLRKIIEDSARLMRDNFTGRQIIFKFDLVNEAMTIYGNSLIGEIFSNLFSNSIKYCNGPVVEISVTAEKLNHGGERNLRVKVSDNGSGIPPERRMTIFSRFNTAAKGTGLGLSLVSEIVESVGGNINVEDRVPGDYKQGTAFVIDFKSPS